jgi:lipoprotein NlpI
VKWLVIGLSLFGVVLVPMGYAEEIWFAAREYARRGDDQFRFAHYDLAIADYSQAIKMESKVPRYYYARAIAENMSGQSRAALMDLNTVIQLNTRFAEAYNARGGIKEGAGDLDGALSDFTQAINLFPRGFRERCNRGLVEYQKGDFSGASDDFHRANELEPTDPYPEIFLWLVRTREGQTAEADQQLSAFLDKHIEKSADHWGAKVCSFLIGRLPESEFVGGTASYFAHREHGHQCEACYYVGIRHLLAGDKAGAVNSFQKSVGMNSRGSQEYLLATFELKRLGKG